MPVLTVFPDAHVESTSVDGTVVRNTGGSTWSDVRTGAGTGANDSSAEGSNFSGRIATDAGSNWIHMTRAVFLFDTSALTASVSISAATFSFATNGDGKTDDYTQTIHIISSNPVSNTALASTDYDLNDFGTTSYGSLSIASCSDVDTTYNDFTVNATGIAAISKTSITKFGTRLSGDMTDTEPSAGGSQISTCGAYHADQTGTSADPKLVITYSSGFTPRVMFY